MWSILENAPYAAAFITGGLITAALTSRAGRRAGWTSEARAAVVAAILIGATIGAGMLPVGGRLPAAGEKSVLGAVLGATLALSFVGWRMRLGAAVFDAAIPSGPIGIAIIRVGCFFAGCCFGTPTTWSVGVRYGAGTNAFREMAAAGLVAPSAATTPAVHPVQLYDALGCLIAAACAVFARRWLRSRLARPLVFGALYATVRFATEFVRYEGLPAIGGLKPLQWVLAWAIVVMLTALVVAERRARAGVAQESDGHRPAGALVSPRVARHARQERRDQFGLVALALAVIVASVMRFATPLETVALTAGGLVLLWPAACRYRILSRTLAPTGAAALMFQGGLPTDHPVPSDSTWPRTYVTVGGAYASGLFTQIVESASGAFTTQPTEALSAEDCQAPPIRPTTDFKHEMSAAGIEFGLRRESSRGTGQSLDLGVFTGSDKVSVAGSSGGQPPAASARTVRFNGMRAVTTLDGRYIGATVGVFQGSPQPTPSDPRGASYGGTGGIAGLRFGPLTSLFGEIMANDVSPVPVSGWVGRINLGIRLADDRSYLRFGFENREPYLSLRWVTPGGFELEPTLGTAGDRGTRFRAVIRKRLGAGAKPRR